MTHTSYALPYQTPPASIPAQPAAPRKANPWSLPAIFSLLRLVFLLAPMAMK
jgi:hypothetical protein